MNITLSMPATLLEASRRYAEAHNTSINAMIRRYFAKVTGEADREKRCKTMAEAFRNSCEEGKWKSDDDWKFDRRECYER